MQVSPCHVQNLPKCNVFCFLQVKRCEVCQRTKRKFDKPAPSLHPIPVSDTWNKVGIDLIELPVSKNGNRYCITLTDYFSKWAEACPIPTKEARHVAAFLHRMFLRHGCPQEIVSTFEIDFTWGYQIS